MSWAEDVAATVLLMWGVGLFVVMIWSWLVYKQEHDEQRPHAEPDQAEREGEDDDAQAREGPGQTEA